MRIQEAATLASRLSASEKDRGRCSGEEAEQSTHGTAPRGTALRLQRLPRLRGFGHESRDCPESYDNLCFRCHKPGHMARDCPSRGNNTTHNSTANIDGSSGARGGNGGEGGGWAPCA